VLAPGEGGGEHGPMEGSAVEGSAVVAAAQRVAVEVLVPAAARVDRAPIVPESHMRALAGAGLFGLFGPPETGGLGVPPPVGRAVFETLAEACGVTFFVWAQHHAPVRLLTASPNADLRDRLLPRLCSGDLQGGVAFAHLRRPGPPPVLARRVAGGFVLRGEAPWVTSWGLAGMFAVAAQVEGDEQHVVFLAVDGVAGPSVTSSPPLRLVAMNASSTVRLAFHDHPVTEADLMVELPLEVWRAQDRLITAQPNPAAFGVAATAIRLLAERDASTAATLEKEWSGLRDESYGLAEEPGTNDEKLERQVELRAWSLELASRAALALVTATGGRAMDLSHPAQRLLREAAFYSIQAQTPALRTATLARLTDGQSGRS
jgi:alkylation response protein AidB-like acyl-CoA dehydrogenase